MNNPKRALIIVNTGSPNSYKVHDVRSYLQEFLADPCVINLPDILRYLLVYGFIAPFRSFRSSKRYARLWTRRGFPLVYHGHDLVNKLKPLLEPDLDLFLAMRYGQPSFRELLGSLSEAGYDELRCIPLFPQFAGATSGSIISLLQKTLVSSTLFDNTKILLHFHGNEGFINIWQRKISRYDLTGYDAILLSFHGIPLSQAKDAHPGYTCESLNCDREYHDKNQFCYRAACFKTKRSIVKGLAVDPEKVYMSFQSRFGRNWLQPSTDATLRSLAGSGKRKVLVVSPSFVADCLETEIEIGNEYQKLFGDAGGEEITLVPSLNAESEWAALLAQLANGAGNQWGALDKVHCRTGKL